MNQKMIARCIQLPTKSPLIRLYHTSFRVLPIRILAFMRNWCLLLFIDRYNPATNPMRISFSPKCSKIVVDLLLNKKHIMTNPAVFLTLASSCSCVQGLFPTDIIPSIQRHALRTRRASTTQHAKRETYQNNHQKKKSTTPYIAVLTLGLAG